MSLAPGTRLGPYLIDAPLGAGGMGVVYRAQDTRLGRPVAVKVLAPALSANHEFHERFEREARVIAALDHPHICPVYDVGEHEGGRYLVMPLLEGQTLANQLQGGPLPLQDVLRHGASLARALAAAHRARVLHRDLKPGNVMVGKSGIRLLDFGLAKFEAVPATALTTTALPGDGPLTREGAVLGTVAYMPPEQLEGKPEDVRTDIFALGCVIYEMVVGRRAFDAPTQAGVIAAIMNGNPPHVSAERPEVPPSLDRAVAKCLARDPDARWQTAADLADELEWIASNREPAETRTRSGRTRDWRRIAMVAAVTLLLGLLGGYGAATRSGIGSGASGTVASPVSFTRLTFRTGYIHSARFVTAADTVVYSATFDTGPLALYTTRPGIPESRPLDIGAGHVASVTRSGELALLLRPTYPQYTAHGTLGRMALTGGTPRELATNVTSADWSPDGVSLAVTRLAGDRYRLEYPFGVVRHESANRLDSVRISPSGQLAVFREAGMLRLVDLANSRPVRTITERWVSLAPGWSPSGHEIWFSGARFGWTSTLHAVDIEGNHLRDLLMGPGVLNLFDVSADGRVLVASGLTSKGLRVRTPADSAERDISWLDWGHVADLSADGRLLLFNEEGSGGGLGGRMYLRPTDGGPAVALADGLGFTLSPDKRSVLARVGERLAIVPTGAGDVKAITVPAGHVLYASWFPDGGHVLSVLRDPQGRVRTFITDLNGDTRQIGRDGLFGHLVSSRSRYILASDGARAIDDEPLARQFVLIRLQDGQDEPVSTMHADDEPLAYTPDESGIYVRTRTEREHIIWKLDLRDGRRTAVVRASPDPNGTSARLPAAITPDGSTYAYTTANHRRDLQVITGLR